MKFLNPCNDIAFKKIFGSDEHKNVTISFLNSILEYNDNNSIQHIDFLNTEQHPLTKEKKENILDILCIDHAGRRYIVEMQVVRVKEFDKRMVYYGAKTYAMQLGESQPYTKLTPVIVLSIIDFVMFPHKKSYKSIHVILDNKTYEHDLKELTFAFVELPKFTKTENKLISAEEKWLYFIKNIKNQDHIPTPLAHDEFQEACGIAERMTWSERELNDYTDALVKITDLENAIDTGKEEQAKKTAHETAIKMAIKMLKKKFDPQTIAEITGLSLAQIQDLNK